MKEQVCNQSINWNFLNLNICIRYMSILRIFVNYRLTFWLEWQHLVWNKQYKCSSVGGNIFSQICYYLDISNEAFELLFLLADVEREKRVKCVIVARCDGGLSYQFIRIKKFNSKQGCITIHPYNLENFWLENEKL